MISVNLVSVVIKATHVVINLSMWLQITYMYIFKYGRVDIPDICFQRETKSANIMVSSNLPIKTYYRVIDYLDNKYLEFISEVLLENTFLE